MTSFKHYKVGKKIIDRASIPSDIKDWKIQVFNYKPIPVDVDFHGKSWADLDIKNSNFKPKWNQLDGKIDRRSHCGHYLIDKEGYPLNPNGRTGICLRGVLGRWGPNHAVDPIVTRWKRDEFNQIQQNPMSGKPILQFVSIERSDVREWAIPGGMVDPGEMITTTLKREFLEEALNILELSQEKKVTIEEKMGNLFANGQEIFKGYVDDPRNTDNSWIETVVVNFHDNENLFNQINLKAGDDARKVKWIDIDQKLNLYANHKKFIELTVNNKFGHW